MSIAGPRVPAQTPPIDPKTGLFDFRWLRWLTGLRSSIDSAPTQVEGGKVQDATNTAAISTTAFPTGSLAEGLYRVSWYAQVVTPAGVSSDFQVTISWTRNAVTQSFVGAVKNGNTTATNESNGAPLIHIDPATPISYAVAYNSNPANAMIYDLDLVLELVSLD